MQNEIVLKIIFLKHILKNFHEGEYTQEIEVQLYKAFIQFLLSTTDHLDSFPLPAPTPKAIDLSPHTHCALHNKQEHKAR
jgi:hypothetical protein